MGTRAEIGAWEVGHRAVACTPREARRTTARPPSFRRGRPAFGDCHRGLPACDYLQCDEPLFGWPGDGPGEVVLRVEPDALTPSAMVCRATETDVAISATNAGAVTVAGVECY